MYPKKVNQVAPEPGNIPDVARACRFLPWIARPRASGGTAKIPTALRNGVLRPVDWRGAGGTMQEAFALAAEHGADGVGLVLTAQSGVVILDVDRPDSVTLSLVDCLDGYAEWSPSGAGVHVWLAGQMAATRRHRTAEFLASGFVTVTGNPLPGRTRCLGKLTDALSLFDVHRGTVAGVVAPPRLWMSDQQVIHRMLRARNAPKVQALLSGDNAGYPSVSEADFALARLFAFYSEDVQQIVRLMFGSARLRGKWLEGVYVRRTAERAVALGGPKWTGGGL